MIRRLNRTIRLLAAVLAAMQFALPAVVSVADGLVAHTSSATQTRPAGVNQDTQTSAHPIDCVLCRYLSANLAEPGIPAAPQSPPVLAPVAEMPIERGVETPRLVHHSRAPPTLLG